MPVAVSLRERCSTARRSSGVFLTNDLVKLGGTHSSFLHLLEGLSRIYALVLPCVADKKHPVLWTDLFEEGLHLAGAGETGLVEHVEVPRVRVSRVPFDASAREETLQGVGGNASIAELAGGATRRGEALDSIAVLLRALADTG